MKSRFGKCQTCEGPTSRIEITRCRDCYSKQVKDAGKRFYCACGAEKSRGGAQCLACLRKAKHKPTPRCACGVVISWAAKRCRACFKKAVAQTLTCPCGQPKSPKAKVCLACWRQARDPGKPGVMRNFNAARFNALLADGDWDLRGLAWASGVPLSTLRAWTKGVTKPLLATFKQVIRALELTTCSTCKGAGVITHREEVQILNAVAPRIPLPTPKSEEPKNPHHWGAEKAREYRQRVKARRAEEAAKEKVAS